MKICSMQLLRLYLGFDSILMDKYFCKDPHSNKFLRIYQTNNFNLTVNYTVCVANCCKHWFYLLFYIEIFRRNPVKFQDFIIFDSCMYVDKYIIFDVDFDS